MQGHARDVFSVALQFEPWQNVTTALGDTRQPPRGESWVGSDFGVLVSRKKWTASGGPFSERTRTDD